MNFCKLYFFVLFFLVAQSICGQNYTSREDGMWDDASTWTKDQIWGPSNPENPINLSVQNITVNHLVVVSGGLLISGSRTITVNDRLFVTGDVVMDGSSSLVNSGTMIIQGDLTLKGSFDLGTLGTLVVTGDLLISEGGDLTASTQLYVFGSALLTGGATFNGMNFWDFPDVSAMGWTGSALPGATLDCTDNPTLCAFATGTLPITLIYFKGVAMKNKTQLTWATAQEENFDKFEIESSLDGSNFSKIGEVQGAGFSKSRKEYFFNDHRSAAGAKYYRLLCLDLDGKFQYSSIIKVQSSLVSPMNQVYPNPVSRGGAIHFSNPLESGLVSLRSINGSNPVFEMTISETIREFNIPDHINAGVYLLQVTHAEGMEYWTIKVF